MSRIELLARKPKQTLAVLALILLAVGVAVGSGANFTAQTANPSNTFTAGTLTMSNSEEGAAILSASDMKPGDSTTGVVDITNTGSITGTFSMNRSALTNSDGANPMSAKMNMVVTDCGTDFDCTAGTNPNVYTGTLSAMTATFSLGTFAPGVGHRYKFDATFDSSADNNYQGDNTSATFTWDATQ
jgi:hypothetical protein